MTTAIFPGTFDPITKGHVDLIARAAKLCDRLIVGVATSEKKVPHYSVEDRLVMCRLATRGIGRVEVQPISGLLVDSAKNNQTSLIIRGLRVASDFEHEFQLAGVNRILAPAIETLFLPAKQEYAQVSSSLVREIIALGGDASAFLNPDVLKYLSTLN